MSSSVTDSSKASLVQGVEVDPPKASITSRLLLAVSVATIGSSFMFGYSIGAVNAPGKFIRGYINESHSELFNGIYLTEDAATWNFSTSVSLFSLGALMGAMMSGYLADHLGRKGTLHWNNVFSIIGSILMTSTYFHSFYPAFHIGRFIIGLNAGIGSSVVPLFITEISPVNWRGALGSMPQLLVTISILISQVAGLKEVLGTEHLWPFIFCVPLIPSVFQVILLFFVPESPKFTLIIKSDEFKATRDLCTYRNTSENDPNIDREIRAVLKEAEAFQNEPKVGMLDLFRRALLWPTFLACFLQASQQLSGISAAMFYSTEIFKSAGLVGDTANYATLAMGAVLVIQTGISVWLVEHPMFGRRSLLLIGKTGMLITTVLLTVCIHVVNLNKISADGEYVLRDDYNFLDIIAPYASIVSVMIFVISFAAGPGSIPFFYVNEIFASNARASASALATGTNWTFNLLIALGFPFLFNLLHEYVFLIFSVCLVIAILVVVSWLPETKGKCLEQVEEALNNRKPICCL